MNITLLGRIPSKKNSKMIICRGKVPTLLSSPKYIQWEKDQLIQLRKLPKPIEQCDISIDFYAPDFRKTDLSNKAESILDLLVKGRIIVDDNWFCVDGLHLNFIGVDKEYPRACVRIREV